MSALRLRSIRFKSGGELRVLRSDNASASLRSDLRRRVRDLVDKEPDMAGFAIVVWDRKGLATTTISGLDQSPIPPLQVGSFAKAALDNHKARVDAERDILGPPTPPNAS